MEFLTEECQEHFPAVYAGFVGHATLSAGSVLQYLEGFVSIKCNSVSSLLILKAEAMPLCKMKSR